MRRRITLGLAALMCLLALASCGGQEGQTAWTEEQGQDILASGAFSEELEELDKAAPAGAAEQPKKKKSFLGRLFGK